MNEQICLTTIDNPFNPIKQFDEWFEFDLEKGYHSCALLARFCHVANSLSEKEYLQEINDGIDRLLAIDPTGMYTKFVSKE